MGKMSVRQTPTLVLMSNIQVMALGTRWATTVWCRPPPLQVSDQTINGRATLDDSLTPPISAYRAAGDDYRLADPRSSSSVGQGRVDFSVNPADYGIPPGDYDVSVVLIPGKKRVPGSLRRSGSVRIPLDSLSPVLNVAGVGEVPFTMISQFGVPDTDSDVA